MENVHEVQGRVERFAFKRLARLMSQVPLLVVDPRSKRGIRPRSAASGAFLRHRAGFTRCGVHLYASLAHRLVP